MRLASFWIAGFAFLLALSACKKSGSGALEADTNNSSALFVAVPEETTGIRFVNELSLSGEFDVFRYRNYYNGGGVAIGDINNDGRPDVFLTSNQGENRLFLNKGNFAFEDITTKAGVGGTRAWSTGVAMADVNGDGLLDIYVCNSGDVKGDDKENELFINNGDLTFTEKAREYGLADKGFSTHAVFFDFDRDGDLDCYVLNNSFRPISTLNLRNLRPFRDEEGGDKLYENQDGRFVDISEKAGIYGSVIGFGLGVTVGDVNMDGWPDIYISNDFYERDYLYLNNKNGTFAEALTEAMPHTSNFSMGADMADINNDGLPDIFVTDMLPQDLQRIKQTTNFTTYDQYQLTLRNGFHHQAMRNTMQLNNGNGTFSDVAQVLGVHATDWSWGALIADLDNNGHKDLFVCNGIYKDVTDQDYVNFLANDENLAAAERGEKIDFKRFVDLMPSTKVHNYAFANQGGLRFEDRSTEWGFALPTHSNGAAYGDLDGDGDLDLIINNVNEKLLVYDNRSNSMSENKSLKIKIQGEGKNTFALGSKVFVYAGGQMMYYENMPMRGFQSSMDYEMVIGLGAAAQADSVVVFSPYRKRWTSGGPVQAGTNLTIDFSKAAGCTDADIPSPKPAAKPLLAVANAMFGESRPRHTENTYIDFDRDKLLYHALSTEGPALAVGDVDGDGADDFYLGGAHRQAGQLWQYRGGKYVRVRVPQFEEDQVFEDIAAVFADVDGDGDLDLIVAAGGSEFLYESANLSSRLYRNESAGGQIRFVRDDAALPKIRQVMSCVVAFDFDNDDDVDLFFGARLHANGYGLPASGYLLENDGKGKFTDVTVSKGAPFRQMGMITGAAAADLDQDGRQDLVIAGEWMPLTVCYNKNGAFPASETTIISGAGWWQNVRIADWNGDGKLDVLGLNLGKNSRFQGSENAPLRLYVKDFDKNGALEPIFCLQEKGKYFPMALRHDLGKELPMVKKKFNSYKEYMDKDVQAVFGSDLDDALMLEAGHFETTLFLQTSARNWQQQALPEEAQFSIFYDALPEDFNGDGLPDILLTGNLSAVKPEVGAYNASYGTLLINDGKGHFAHWPAWKSGLSWKGEARAVRTLRLPGNRRVALCAFNNGPVEAVELPR
ncbi:MAG TPA: VCBS repeat-containing protein [Saprospiraceae bacterium]|nr:VCBS repeat-containing protein [Saprospiraceae bacterium]